MQRFDADSLTRHANFSVPNRARAFKKQARNIHLQPRSLAPGLLSIILHITTSSHRLAPDRRGPSTSTLA